MAEIKWQKESAKVPKVQSKFLIKDREWLGLPRKSYEDLG